jgi:2-C-methyl-D-erythritol 4-phosphate cytidylyltransferase
VIAAAGSGQRLRAGGPKAFVPLSGRRLVEWSIAACRAARSVRSIVVACPPGHVHDLAGGDVGVVDGGATRAQSVANALEAVGTELVAIHDAGRPLVTAELIEDVIATLLANPDADGAIAAAPVTDTIKQVANQPGCNAFSLHRDEKTLHRVESTLDRGSLWAAQTPQVFRVEALREALGVDPGCIAVATDEAMLVEAAGGRVLIHSAPAENIKVTTPLDLKVAELLLAQRSAQ